MQVLSGIMTERDVAQEILQSLEALELRLVSAFDAAETEHHLRELRADFLGKKGELTQILKLLAEVPNNQKKTVGEAVNRLKGAVENAFNTKLEVIAAAERAAELNQAPFDLSLPGRVEAAGHLHPITQVQMEVLEILSGMGFETAWGPEVELEVNNFNKLAFPPDHPATDMQDTFWVSIAGALEGTRSLLRTHTSSVQIREMSRRGAPLAFASTGPVYRRDDDVTHSPMFHQLEAVCVGEGLSFADLKGVLLSFVQRLYGGEARLRFRPSYFPFVEPGAEVDIGCVFCSVEQGTTPSCRVCKGTSWLEVLGCGMIHPDVLKNCGVDSEQYQGFAFGLGIERVAMLRYGISDIRVLFENDSRMLAQF